MTDFNYGDVIEYIDDTFDENMEAAKKWAREHNTTLEELIDRRVVQGDIMYRYFQIGSEPQVVEPTAEQIKMRTINQLKMQLSVTDYVVIKIAEGVATADEYADVIAQRQQWRQEINALEAE